MEADILILKQIMSRVIGSGIFATPGAMYVFLTATLEKV
jgi:hypothetical protein